MALGVGRIGAIMGPLVVGYLVDSGWSPLALYVGAAVVMLVVAVAIGAVQGPATVVAGRPGSVSTDQVSSDRD